MSDGYLAVYVLILGWILGGAVSLAGLIRMGLAQGGWPAPWGRGQADSADGPARPDVPLRSDPEAVPAQPLVGSRGICMLCRARWGTCVHSRNG